MAADRRLAGLAAGMLVLLAACGGQSTNATTSGFVESNPDGMHGAVLTDQYVAPDVTLTATDGSDFSLAEDTDAPVTLVFFGYTHCPDICSIVMADIASAVTRLGDEDQEQVDVLLVTSDPARDDPATLRAYLDRFNPEFEGLTGDLETIVEAANALGVAIEKGPKLPSGGYEVTHGTQIVAIDENDRSPIVWTEGTSAEHLAEDLTALLDQREESPAP
ncbi:MAG TPA: SCO family protein [Nocardioidaceae bacterium]